MYMCMCMPVGCELASSRIVCVFSEVDGEKMILAYLVPFLVGGHQGSLGATFLGSQGD